MRKYTYQLDDLDRLADGLVGTIGDSPAVASAVEDLVANHRLDLEGPK